MKRKNLYIVIALVLVGALIVGLLVALASRPSRSSGYHPSTTSTSCPIGYHWDGDDCDKNKNKKKKKKRRQSLTNTINKPRVVHKARESRRSSSSSSRSSSSRRR